MKENKNWIRSACLACLMIFLVGCDATNDSLPANTNTDFNPTNRFKIGDTTWQTTLPLGWSEQRDIVGTILVGQYQDQNFTIVQKPGYSSDLSNQIIAEVQNNFFELQVQTVNPQNWIYQAKRSIDEPTRVFHQEIMPVPGTNTYLIGTCSYEYWSDRTENCSAILGRWQQEVVNN